MSAIIRGIKLTLAKGEGLIAADSNGLSDPYVVIEVGACGCEEWQPTYDLCDVSRSCYFFACTIVMPNAWVNSLNV